MYLDQGFTFLELINVPGPVRMCHTLLIVTFKTGLYGNLGIILY